MHAAVEALVTILDQKKIVKVPKPTHFSFREYFRHPEGLDEGQAFGVRSWLMEDKLGGILCLFVRMIFYSYPLTSF